MKCIVKEMGGDLVRNAKKARRTKYNTAVYQSLTFISQFGINMLVPIFLCSFVGIYLDQKCGTSFLMVLFFFVGALAGFRNVYLFAKKTYKNEDGNKESDKKKSG